MADEGAELWAMVSCDQHWLSVLIDLWYHSHITVVRRSMELVHRWIAQQKNVQLQVSMTFVTRYSVSLLLYSITLYFLGCGCDQETHVLHRFMQTDLVSITIGQTPRSRPDGLFLSAYCIPFFVDIGSWMSQLANTDCRGVDTQACPTTWRNPPTADPPEGHTASLYGGFWR
jgi:hypothetical protein